MTQLSTVLSDLRCRLRRVVLVRGLCWTLVLFGSVVTTSALIDSTWHVESAAIRTVLLAIALLVGMGSLAVLIARPFLGPWDDTTLALLVERWQPQLRDQIAIAAALRGMNDGSQESAPESPPLQRRVVRDAEAALPDQLPAVLVAWSAAFRAGAALAFVAVFVISWFLASPANAYLSFVRQFQPFSAPEWPRSTELVLLDGHLQPLGRDESRCIADEPLTLYVWNRRGKLPHDLRLDTASAQGECRTLATAATSLRDEAGRERSLAVATTTPSAGLLRVRATGGDDRTMSWTELDIVPAPRLERFVTRVEPPAYTGLPVVTEERAAGHIEGLVGSRAVIDVQSNIPLHEVVLHRDDTSPQPVSLSSDGRNFRIELTIDRPGRNVYWFDLTDEYGLVAPRPTRYEVRGRPDQPPTVRVRQPPVELTATPTAKLPLEMAADDDLGLSEISLRWSRSNLSTSADAASALPEVRKLWTQPEGESQGPTLQASADAAWDLTTLAVQPGTSIAYLIEAADNREPESQTAVSRQRKVRIISPEEKRREIRLLQAGIAELIRRTESRQPALAQSLRDLETQWSVAELIRPQDRDLLQTLEQRRRRIVGDLTEDRSGLRAQLRLIEQQLDWNRLDDPQTRSRLERLRRHLSELLESILPEWGDALAQADQVLSGQGFDEPLRPTVPADAAEFEAALATATERQAAMTSILSAMLAELSEWNREFDLARAVDELLITQQELHAQTTQVGAETVGRPLDSLTPQQLANLETVADRQQNLVVDVDRIQEQFELQHRDDNSPTDRETGPLLSTLANGRMAARMKQAADAIARNQIGRARQTQGQILDELARIAETTSGPKHSRYEATLQAMERTLAEVGELRRRQQDLQREFAESSSQSDAARAQQAAETMSSRQSQVADDLRAIAVRLRQRLLATPGRTAEQAVIHADAAANAMSHSRGDQVEAHQKEVLELLQHLESQVKDEFESAQQREHMQAILDLAERLPPLQAAQHRLADETDALEAVRQDQGRLGRRELKVLEGLTETQRGLATEVRTLQRQAEDNDLITQVLTSAQQEMQAALVRLRDRTTDPSTSELQRAAAQHLGLLSSALRETDHARAGRDAPPAPVPGDDWDRAKLDRLELSLLRAMQSVLLERTERLNREDATDANRNLQHRRRAALAQEQEQLATRLDELLQRISGETFEEGTGTESSGVEE